MTDKQTQDGSSIEILPNEAKFMAENAKKRIAITRERLINKAWDACKNQECKHKFLGFTYFSHPMWESKEEFMKSHKLMFHLNMTMDMANSVCDSVIAAAEYKLSHPEDSPTIRISLTDFALLNSDM